MKRGACLSYVLATLVFCIFSTGDLTMAAPAQGARTDGGHLDVTEGGAGVLGAGTVGVDWVAPDGSKARISVGGKAGGLAWSTHTEVGPRRLVHLSGSVFEVSSIVPAQRGGRGHVVFAPAPADNAAASIDTVPLTSSDPLMLGGPDIEAMTELRVKSLSAGAAEVEWWPAMHAREDADPASVKAARIAAGDHFEVARTSISVLSIEQATPDHPARVMLKFARAG